MNMIMEILGYIVLGVAVAGFIAVLYVGYLFIKNFKGGAQ